LSRNLPHAVPHPLLNDSPPRQPPRHWWVTRPQPEADLWVQQLRAAGVNAHALPLLTIGPAPRPASLAEAARQIEAGAWDAVMFVSVNAVRGLLGAHPQLAACFGRSASQVGGPTHGAMNDAMNEGVMRGPGPRAWVVGPGTAQALRSLQVADAAIDQPAANSDQFDSETFWKSAKKQVYPAYRVLFVRGADEQGEPAGRDWLSQQVLAAGGQVAHVAAYSRVAPVDLAAQLQGAPRDAGWVLSSSQAVASLASVAGVLGVAPGGSQPVAVCTHERVAQAAGPLGFGRVRVCRPSLADVLASIESLA
jgi:uroporphyrinogen-III synthase